MAAIAGQLQFTPGGNPFGAAGGGVMGLALDYGNAYNSALNANQTNYNNILAGYQNNYNSLQAGQQGVGAGYGTLMSGIQNTLGADYGVPGTNAQWGIAAPAAAAINKLYAAQTGQAFDQDGNPTGKPTGGSLQQDLIDRGLGNTTASQNAIRGATSDYGTAIGGLGANLAQTYAGYQANIGEAYLGQQNQMNQSLANQNNQQLNWMNSVQIPYPNAGLYSQLYQQQGQAQQAAAAQAQQLQIFKMGLGRGGATTGGVSIPNSPRGGPYGSGGGSFPSAGPGPSAYARRPNASGTGPAPITGVGSGIGGDGSQFTGGGGSPFGGGEFYPPELPDPSFSDPYSLGGYGGGMFEGGGGFDFGSVAGLGI